MKTKVFKSVMPFLVMILAMGLSYAVNANKVVQMGYYDDPYEDGIQSQVTNCVKDGNGNLCKAGIYQLFDTPALNAGDELRQP